MRKMLVGALALGVVAGGTIAALNARKRYNRWGATDDEVRRAMPGDDLVESPGFESTRAITIDAPPQYVWPWLLQMGSGRGGAYTYDWIENLFGLDMHSADEIVPEWQHTAAGDRLPLGTKGEYMEAMELDPERTLVFLHRDGNWSWTFTLQPLGDTQTRFVSRNRITMEDAPFGAKAAMVVIDPGAFVMERKMLRGIKERAERLYVEKQQPVPAAVGQAEA